MLNVFIVRAGRGIGAALAKSFVESNASVTAYSGSERKLTELRRAISSPSLRTVQGDAGSPSELLAAAAGADVIVCPIYTTYDEKPARVRRILQAVQHAMVHTGARAVVLEGIYRPQSEGEPKLPLGPRVMRIRLPELYGPCASRTLIHYALRRAALGKPVKLLTSLDAVREYVYLDDAARHTAELAASELAYGKHWQLRGSGPATARELISLAASAAGTVPQYEKRGGWKLRLLKWYEPRVEQLLERYNGASAAGQGELYAGSRVTAYEHGIASTVSGLMAKYRKQQGTSLGDW